MKRIMRWFRAVNAIERHWHELEHHRKRERAAKEIKDRVREYRTYIWNQIGWHYWTDDELIHLRDQLQRCIVDLDARWKGRRDQRIKALQDELTRLEAAQ